MKHGTRGVCIREVQKDLKDSAKLLIEDKISKFNANGFRPIEREIRTPGEGLIIFRGMTDYNADSIKSLEGFDWAWVEEAHTLTPRSLELLRPTLRRPGSEIWFSWNPRHETDPVDAFLRGDHVPNNAIVVEANYTDNPFFPEELEEERTFDEIHKPNRYGHIWLGQYEPMAAGAIFSMANINKHRRAPEDLPRFKRALVVVDPAGSTEEGANETGIVVVALGEDDRGYVLDDLSLVGAPQEWAQRAVAAYDLYDADAIVAETNFGGDMVANTIRAERPTVRVIEVRAQRAARDKNTSGTDRRTGKAKALRAEPVSALYSLGRISHVGALPKLEAQMCLVTAGGYEGPGSPDRVDAMVWGFKELFPRMTQKSNRSASSLPKTANSGYSPHRWRQ